VIRQSNQFFGNISRRIQFFFEFYLFGFTFSNSLRNRNQFIFVRFLRPRKWFSAVIAIVWNV